jgi:hypothetical protein
MHYRDGKEAKVGDIVKGTLGGRRGAGEVLQLFPGADTCNIVIGFVDVLKQSAGDGTDKAYTLTDGSVLYLRPAFETCNSKDFDRVAEAL